jgi:hypothetical protein
VLIALCLVAAVGVEGCSVTKTPVAITIGGGAWLSKKGGQSDILRGLQVYLCKADSPLKTEVSSLVDGLTKKTAQEMAEKKRQQLRTEQRNALVAKCKAEQEALDQQQKQQREELFEKLHRETQELEETLKEEINEDVITTEEAVQKVDSFEREGKERLAALQAKQEAEMRELGAHQEKALKNIRYNDAVNAADFEKKAQYDAITKAIEAGDTGKIAAKFSVLKATTNIDGKYTLTQVPPGSYVLYADFTNAFSAGYWIVPITVAETEQQPQIQRDLENSNLALGVNRE